MKYYNATQYPDRKWEVCVLTDERQSQMEVLPSFPAERVADIVNLARIAGRVTRVTAGVHRVWFTTDDKDEFVGFGWEY